MAGNLVMPGQVLTAAGRWATPPGLVYNYNYNFGTVANGQTVESAENERMDKDETIAELEEEAEELRAQLLEARLLLGRIMRGDQPTDAELKPHLEAVAEDFE